jgi:hypothetical protein
MRPERQRSVASRLFWGVILLSAGIIFWLDRMGRVDAGDYLEWWPVVAVVAGVVELVQRRWAGGVVWLVIGSYFLFPRLGYPRLPLFYLIGAWPLLISVAGITLIAHVFRRPAKQQRGPTFTSAAFMGGHNRVVRSEGLAGGEAVAVMAGCEIEFTPMKSGTGEIEVDALVMWGGVEIRVPIGWRVVTFITPILGGYVDKTAPATAGAPTLVLRGAIIMGGLEVKNSKELA